MHIPSEDDATAPGADSGVYDHGGRSSGGGGKSLEGLTVEELYSLRDRARG